MTIAQQLEQKGMQQAIQQCMQRCKEEVIQLDICTVAHLLLQQGIDYNVVMKVTGLSEEEELTPLSD